MKERNNQLINGLSELVGYKNPELFKATISEWQKVLEHFPLSSNDLVSEFGPGISPKLIFALDELNFEGELELIDLDSQVLQAQRYIYSLLSPAFKLNIRAENLFAYSMQHTSLLVGNHLLDDIVAEEFAQFLGLDYQRIFSNPGQQEFFWKRVKDNQEVPLNTVSRLSTKLMEIKRGGFVVINNYTANFDVKNGIRTRTDVVDHFLDVLGGSLIEKGFRETTLNLGNTDKKWLAMVKES